MRVQADREACIQAGNCVMVAADVFDEDVDPSGELADRVREAVKLCPSSALSLAED